MTNPEFHVLVRRGDGMAELAATIGELGLDEVGAGVHRAFFVTRANQTVVMAAHPASPVVAPLRARGWSEPGL